MKSEVERVAGSALLRDYGDFFKRQQLELRTAIGFTPLDLEGGLIQAEFSTREDISAIGLTRSDNVVLTKILGVFSVLCIEVDELRKEAKESHLPAVVMCGNREEQIGLNVKETEAICRVSAFIQRCQQTLNNFCLQLVYLYDFDLVNLQGVQLHYLFSVLSELGVVLVELDESVRDGTLARRWGSTVAAVSLALRKQDDSVTNREGLSVVTRDIQERLFSQQIFLNTLKSITSLKQTSKGCRSLAAELNAYIKLAIATLDKAADENQTPDMLHKCIKVNVLYVLAVHLFEKNDKKTYKALTDLNTKAHWIPLHGRCIFLPEKFLEQTLESCSVSSTSRQSSKMDRIRKAYLATRSVNMERDVATLQLNAADWVLSFDRICNEDETHMNSAQINQQAQLLLRGIEIAGEIKHFVVSTVSMHINQMIPLSRSAVHLVVRAVVALRAIRRVLHRRANASRGTYAVLQHLSYRATVSIISLKKCLTKKRIDTDKIDEVTCAKVAEQAMRGAITPTRITVAAVALCFLSPHSTPESSDGWLSSLLNKINTLLHFNRTMDDLCDGSWLYWYPDIIDVYFNQSFIKKSDAFFLKQTFNVLDECGTTLKKIDGVIDEHFSEEFAAKIQTNYNDLILRPTNQAIETDLRLHVHSHLRLDEDPFIGEKMKRFLLITGDFKHLLCHMSLTCGIEHYLSADYYNLTTIELADKKTYSEMRRMAAFKFHLELIEDELPTQTFEQGLDVLEIMRNIHVFVSKYLYNLNNQMFIEHRSHSKALNTITIRHVANSIRAHGTGVMNTTVNFTYQFLRDKFYTFSQFMFDEHIKSRLAKDRKISRENTSRGDVPYTFKNADKFNKGIRNLGIVDDGQSYLDLFRGLISQIGNAMGYVRMIRSGGRHCCEGATVFLPSIDETKRFKDLCERDGLTEVTLAAAENLDHNIETLVNNFSGGTEYFKLLVDVFAPVFRSSKNVHLKNFFMIVPPLTVNFVENMILAKDKMSKKDKTGAAFTDDGFAMGVAYILKLLDQDSELDGLHWFDAVWSHIATERSTLERQKAAGNEQLQRALALTEKKIDVLEQEFKLLYYSFSSARIFFQ